MKLGAGHRWALLTMPCDVVEMLKSVTVTAKSVDWAGPGYVATPIWDREEITSTLAQYKDTAYAASLESFGKGIVEAVKKGHTPEQIARCVCSAVLQSCGLVTHLMSHAPKVKMVDPSECTFNIPA